MDPFPYILSGLLTLGFMIAGAEFALRWIHSVGTNGREPE